MITIRKRKFLTAVFLFGIAAGMVGLSFAAVPLYRMFCQATGYAGTPRTEGVTASQTVSDTRVTVKFDANVNSALPWEFRPEQRSIDVNLGAETLIFYRAKNNSSEPIVGTATFNVQPDKAGKYFNKLECFCFSEQLLQPGEETLMPVVFYVDPAMASDPDAKDVTRITLSYTFFRAEDDATTTAKPVAATEGKRHDG